MKQSPDQYKKKIDNRIKAYENAYSDKFTQSLTDKPYMRQISKSSSKNISGSKIITTAVSKSPG